jgi:hypothetical protein
MKVLNQLEDHSAASEDQAGADPLHRLVAGRATTGGGSNESAGGVIVGELIGMSDDGRTPLVLYPGQSASGAIAARSTMDLHGDHVGKQVVLVFEGGDPAKPIVMGVLRDGHASALEARPGQVEVESDGERLIVTAKEQLVLHCGKARITLTRAGKVLVEGTYISSRSSGVNRISGGSVQLN